eukprot:182833_1
MAACLKSCLHQFNNIYVYSLCFMIVIHFTFLLVLDAIQDTGDTGTVEYLLMSILLLIEWSLCIFQSKLLYQYVFLTDIKPILCLYVSKVIACSDIYLLLYRAQETQFDIPNNAVTRSASYIQLSLLFFNYSASTQTCTGVSDAIPVGSIAELFSILQLLLFGLTYNIFILSLALLRFSEYQIDQKSNSNNSDSTFLNNNSGSNFYEHEHASSDLLNFEKLSINDYESCLKCHEFTLKYILLITIVLEMAKLLIVYLICDDKDDGLGSLTCGASISTFGLVVDVILLMLCIICVIIKLRMVKLIGYVAQPSVWTFVGAYLSTLILFAMMYFDLWLLTKDGNNSAFKTKYDQHQYWTMTVHFLYFSATSFTSHGSGAVIQTWNGVAYFIQGFEMLLAVLFICIVFGIGLLYVDVQRSIATEQFIALHTSDEFIEKTKNYDLPKFQMHQTHSLIKAGLVTQKVSNMLTAARQKSNQNLVFND